MRWIYRLALKLRKLQLAHQHQPKICVHLEQEFVCGTLKQTAPPLNCTTLPIINICTDSRIKFREHIAKKATGYSFIYAVETGRERRAVGPTCSLSLRVRINVHDSKTEVHQNCKYRIPGEITASATVSWIWNHMILSCRLQVCGASRTPRNLNS